MRRAFAPLRHRSFRRLIAGQLTSNVGDAFYAVALPWYVLAAHGGVLLLGSALAVYGIARTFTLAVGGHASDRWRPWTVMMSADVLRALAVGALAIVTIFLRPQFAILGPVALVLGAGEGMFLPGSFSIVPSLLPDRDLQPGNALSSGGTQLATLVGPALAGVAVARLGSAPAFAIDSASFIASALTLAAIRTLRSPASRTPTSTGDDPRGNVPTLRGLLATESVLWIIFVIDIAANLGSGGMTEVALPVLAHGPFGSGAAGYGALIAAFGAGALLGTLIAARTPTPDRPAIVASVAFAAQAIFMAITPYLGGTALAAAALACFGILNGFANVLTITAMQHWAPPGTIGRVMGFVMLGSFGIFPLSVLLGGIVVHNLGPAAFFPIAAVALLLALSGALLFPQWQLRNQASDHPSVA